MNHTELAKALTIIVHEIRPDWDNPGIAKALNECWALPFPDVAVAAITAAYHRRDQASPAIIALDGDHWPGGDQPPHQAPNRRPCTVCGYPAKTHAQAMRAWPLTDRHNYQPEETAK